MVHLEDYPEDTRDRPVVIDDESKSGRFNRSLEIRGKSGAWRSKINKASGKIVKLRGLTDELFPGPRNAFEVLILRQILVPNPSKSAESILSLFRFSLQESQIV